VVERKTLADYQIGNFVYTTFLAPTRRAARLLTSMERRQTFHPSGLFVDGRHLSDLVISDWRIARSAFRALAHSSMWPEYLSLLTLPELMEEWMARALPGREAVARNEILRLYLAALADRPNGVERVIVSRR
jgi:hypothetical protein